MSHILAHWNEDREEGVQEPPAQAKMGLLLALEQIIESQLKMYQRADNADMREDSACYLAAAEWLIAQNLPKYANMGYFHRLVCLLEERIEAQQ